MAPLNPEFKQENLTATDKQVKFAMPENYDFHSASAEKVDVKMDTSSQEDIAKGNNQGGTVTNTFDDVPPAVKYWQRLEARYGSKIKHQLAMPRNEGTPHYISELIPVYNL